MIPIHSYSAGNTGGNASVTLSTSQLPSHTHSFTPEGMVASHTHGLNNHTHAFTPAGAVSSHAHGLAGHTHSMAHTHTRGTMEITGNFHAQTPDDQNSVKSGAFYNSNYNTKIDAGFSKNNYPCGFGFQASRSWSGSTSQPSPANTGGNSGNTAAAAPVFTGKAGTTSGNSGATESTAPAFTGKAGTTGETGAGSAVNIMPPYEVANCWRRTA